MRLTCILRLLPVAAADAGRRDRGDDYVAHSGPRPQMTLNSGQGCEMVMVVQVRRQMSSGRDVVVVMVMCYCLRVARREGQSLVGRRNGVGMVMMVKEVVAAAVVTGDDVIVAAGTGTSAVIGSLSRVLEGFRERIVPDLQLSHLRHNSVYVSACGRECAKYERQRAFASAVMQCNCGANTRKIVAETRLEESRERERESGLRRKIGRHDNDQERQAERETERETEANEEQSG